jgi:polygalacturonase
MLAKASWPSSSTPFMNGKSITNFEISGSGKIDGQGAAWWAAGNGGPVELILNDASVLELTGVTFTNSPMMHIQFQNACSQMTINGIHIATDVGEASTSHNTDGIDISGQHAIIENCQITTGDDNIAIGANTLTTGGTSDITVTGNTFGGTGGVKSADLQGHGISIGSHTENGVSGITISNNTCNGLDYGLRIKSASSEGGVVQNITYSNDTLNNIRKYAIILDAIYPSVPEPPSSSGTATVPKFTNIHFTGIKMNNCAQAGYILGLPDQPATNITIQLSGTATKAFELAYAGTSSAPIDFTGSTFTVNGSTKNRVLLYTGAFAKGY